MVEVVEVVEVGEFDEKAVVGMAEMDRIRRSSLPEMDPLAECMGVVRQEGR